MGIHSRHADKSTRFLSLVHIYFSSIFKPCLARIMPSVNSPVFTKMQARLMPIKKQRIPSGLRQSQQVRQNAGKHPKSGFLLRLGNATDKFK
jgi:hypothetical protein